MVCFLVNKENIKKANILTPQLQNIYEFRILVKDFSAVWQKPYSSKKPQPQYFPILFRERSCYVWHERSKWCLKATCKWLHTLVMSLMKTSQHHLNISAHLVNNYNLNKVLQLHLTYFHDEHIYKNIGTAMACFVSSQSNVKKPHAKCSGNRWS